jgi:hypothetical protein
LTSTKSKHKTTTVTAIIIIKINIVFPEDTPSQVMFYKRHRKLGHQYAKPIAHIMHNKHEIKNPANIAGIVVILILPHIPCASAIL